MNDMISVMRSGLRMALLAAITLVHPASRGQDDFTAATPSFDGQLRLALASIVGLMPSVRGPSEPLLERGGSRIRVDYDDNFAASAAAASFGEFQGFGTDMFRLVASKAGLAIDTDGDETRGDFYEDGRRSDTHVVVGMARTAARASAYDFIGPFMSMPSVLVTRVEDRSRPTEIREIGHGTLAIPRGHFLAPELRARHPDLRLVELDRQEQILAAVASGAADAGLGSLSVVSDLIDQQYLGRLDISGGVKGGDSQLYFAVPTAMPGLAGTLRQAFASVNDDEVSALRTRWLSREIHTGLSWQQVLQVAIPVALLVLSYVCLLRRGNRRLRCARKKEEAARRIAEDSAAARSRFLAYVSHELRGSLAAISSATVMLKTSDDLALRTRLLDAVDHTSSGLLQLLESMLQHEQSMERALCLDPVTTHLETWWEHALAPARIAAERKGLTFAASAKSLSVHASVDSVRLQQVVQNLLNNAIKFTSSGRIEVTAAYLPALEDESQPATLRVEVCDSGPGLTQADREVLFTPYAQGAQGRLARHGAGLGLAISRQIVQAMGGQLNAEVSASGTGACFVLLVPLAVESTTVALTPVAAPWQDDLVVTARGS